MTDSTLFPPSDDGARCQCCGHDKGVCPKCGSKHWPRHRDGCERCVADARWQGDGASQHPDNEVLKQRDGEHPARNTDPDTSHEAANLIKHKLSAMRADTLVLVSNFPNYTSNEYAKLRGAEDLRKYGRRLSELRDRKLVEWNGKRKCSVSGRTCKQWRVTDAGRDTALRLTYAKQ